MIKNIAVAIVRYNGDKDNELIFKVTEIRNLEELKRFIKFAESKDKEAHIKSEYRIEIFSCI